MPHRCHHSHPHQPLDHHPTAFCVVLIAFPRAETLSLIEWNSIEWNSIRLSGPAHGTVTKTVHKTLPGGGGGQGGKGPGVVGVRGGGGQGDRGWWGSGGSGGGQADRGGVSGGRGAGEWWG